jgi:hypothetical protein
LRQGRDGPNPEIDGRDCDEPDWYLAFQILAHCPSEYAGHQVLFPSRSIEFKVALGIILAFPYLALAIYARNWTKWIEMLCQSISASFLFMSSFLLLSALIADYWWLRFWSVTELYVRSMNNALLLFPGLALLIIVISIVTLSRASFPYNMLLGLLAHALYLTNLMFIAPFL